MRKIVEKISSSVASNFIANENELINSVTSTPTKCAPKIWPVLSSKIIFTKPSLSDKDKALPLADNGNLPTLYLSPNFLLFQITL